MYAKQIITRVLYAKHNAMFEHAQHYTYAKIMCRCEKKNSPEIDDQQNVPKQRLDDDTRPDCAHNGPVEPYETGGMPPWPTRTQRGYAKRRRPFEDPGRLLATALRTTDCNSDGRKHNCRSVVEHVEVGSQTRVCVVGRKITPDACTGYI